MAGVSITQDSSVLTIYKRILDGAPEQIQLFFAAQVLDRYRGQTSYGVSRTDTIGRLTRKGSWSVDFGITAEDALIHLSLGDLTTRVPEGEREHWLEHIVTLPHSKRFMRTRVSGHACMEDGDFRTW